MTALHLPPLPKLPHQPGHWKKRLQRATARQAVNVQEAAARDFHSADVSAWHALHKRLKQYRYLVTALARPPPDLLRSLDDLGRIQDALVVRQVVRNNDRLAPFHEALLAHETQEQREAQTRIRARWPALSRAMLLALIDQRA